MTHQYKDTANITDIKNSQVTVIYKHRKVSNQFFFAGTSS